MRWGDGLGSERESWVGVVGVVGVRGEERVRMGVVGALGIGIGIRLAFGDDRVGVEGEDEDEAYGRLMDKSNDEDEMDARDESPSSVVPRPRW